MAQNVDEICSGWKKSPICDPQISCRPAVCAKLAAMVSPAPNPRLNAEAPVPNPRSARPLVVMPAELLVGESFSQVQQSQVPHWVAFSTCLPGKMDLKRGDVCFGVAVRDNSLLLSGKLKLQSRIHRLEMCFLSWEGSIFQQLYLLYKFYRYTKLAMSFFFDPNIHRKKNLSHS